MRRVKTPFSVLTERGHSFNFLQVNSFAEGLTFGADITVLASWMLTPEEVSELHRATRQRVVIADCSDPSLLDDVAYRQQIEVASLVTVPNEYLRRVVKSINPNTMVAPSCVDLPHFAAANKIKPDEKQPITIGCLGPYDWHLVADALEEISPSVRILADIRTTQALRGRDLKGIEIELNPYNLPEVIRNCHFGLCPIEGESGIDRVWEHEYGSLCRPVIVSHSKEKDTWIAKIEELIRDTKKRAELGQAAFELANENRATKRAGEYLSIYRKRLPHLFLR